MDVDKSNYHLWFIEDYLDKNKDLSIEKLSAKEAWDELRKNADKDKVEHPHSGRKSWFEFRRGRQDLSIKEVHRENERGWESDEAEEINDLKSKKLTLDTFRKAFNRERKRRIELKLEHKE